MEEEETRAERVKRFSKIWWKSRADAGSSQEFMAIGLNVSKKTIQNWEKGLSSPSLFQGLEWFRIIALNPMDYFFSFLYPVEYDNISPLDTDEKIEEALFLLLKNSPAIEKRQLLFLISGRHGSSWFSLLQMFTAHCHTSMQSRVSAARVILENYEIEKNRGNLVCPDNIQPDIDVLKDAVKEGKRAAEKGHRGYVFTGKDIQKF